MRVWALYAFKVGELMMASTQVIAYRSRLLAASSGSRSASHQRELSRMGQEKFAAAAESMQAMALRSMTLWPQLGFIAYRQVLAGMTAFTSLATSTPAQLPARQRKIARDAFSATADDVSRLSRSTARVATHSLEPIRTRAKANARRLARRRK